MLTDRDAVVHTRPGLQLQLVAMIGAQRASGSRSVTCRPESAMTFTPRPNSHGGW